MPKANIRQPAILWFNEKYPEVTEHIITSKFYSSSESWSKSRVWFFQIPQNLIEPTKIKYIHLLCQNHLSGEPFIYLKVPTLFLLRNEKSFEIDRKTKMMRIYLSAEAADMFQEVRKGNKLDFKIYIQ